MLTLSLWDTRLVNDARKERFFFREPGKFFKEMIIMAQILP